MSFRQFDVPRVRLLPGGGFAVVRAGVVVRVFDRCELGAARRLARSLNGQGAS